MATALDAAHTRQPLPIIPTEEAEQISALLSLFDEALAMHHKRSAIASTVPGVSGFNALLTIWGNQNPHAEYAVRLWASANRLRLDDSESFYEPTAQYPNGSTIRAIDVRDGNGFDDVFRVQWPEQAAAAPPPRNVVTLPVATSETIDDAATRFSLLEIE